MIAVTLILGCYSTCSCDFETTYIEAKENSPCRRMERKIRGAEKTTEGEGRN